MRRRLLLASLAACAGLFPLACKKKPPAFSCAGLQSRAAACASQTLSQVRRQIKARSGGDTEDRSARQFKMFEYRFRKKLRQRRVEKQCIKYSGSKEPEHARRLERMRACYAKRRCDAFAGCFLGLRIRR